MATTVTATDFDAAPGLDGWRYLLGRIETAFTADSPGGAAALVPALVAAAGDRSPDIDLRGPLVVVTLPGGADLQEADLDAARAISTAAAEHGLTGAPTGGLRVEVAIDALDIDAVRPFWKAALAYEDEPTPEGRQVIALVDPRRIGPPVWFQQMDAVRPERNHIHVDLTVAADVAEQRVADVVAAGGRHLMSHERAFHVLADVEGNEVCICTCLDRD